MVPTLATTLGVKGHRPVVGTRDCKDVLYVFAVMNLISGALHTNTLSFVTSPDTVIALALAGRLDFDPTTDTLTNDAGCTSASAPMRANAGLADGAMPTERKLSRSAGESLSCSRNRMPSRPSQTSPSGLYRAASDATSCAT